MRAATASLPAAQRVSSRRTEQSCGRAGSVFVEPGSAENVTRDDRRPDPDVTFPFGREAGVARDARRALQPLFPSNDPLAESVRLVASELVSNVFLHTDGGGCLVAWADDPIRLEVHDEDPTLPATGNVLEGSVSGRGLSIVSNLADRWGVDPWEGGKATWAEFQRPGASAHPLAHLVDAPREPERLRRGSGIPRGGLEDRPNGA